MCIRTSTLSSAVTTTLSILLLFSPSTVSRATAAKGTAITSAFTKSLPLSANKGPLSYSYLLPQSSYRPLSATTTYSRDPSLSESTLKMSMSSDSDKTKTTEYGYIDIGVNFLDPMYSGNYRGKQRHESDLPLVLKRASEQNVQKMIVTAGTIEESQHAFDLVQELREQSDVFIQLNCSVGVHPTRCQQEFGFSDNDNDIDNEKPHTKINEMRTLIQKGLDSNAVVTLGELGLDYARTEFCSIEHQKRGLLAQLELALEFPQLPLFIHNRDTGTDLYDVLKEYYCDKKDNPDGRPIGVIHSFDDSLELALQFIELGMYIGINGCSLKTPENLEVLRSIPLSKIVLETDGPWCDIRPSHASFQYVQTKFPTKQEKKFEMGCCVKSRTEPCHLVQVAEVVAGVKGISVEEVKEVCWNNTHNLFQML